MPEENKVLNVSRVSKHFYKNSQKTLALDDISFSLTAGSITALIGLNGAGKTTLLRIIAGILEQNSGLVEISSGKVTGFLSYDTGLYERLTIREFLKFSGELRSVPFRVIHSKIEKFAEEMMFSLDLDSRIADLSAGTKQKVAFCSVMLNNPDILLLDEPFSNVDIQVVTLMLKYLEEMRGKGCCIILSTHNLYEVQKTADYYLILHKGKNEKFGKTREEDQEINLKETFLQIIGIQHDEV